MNLLIKVKYSGKLQTTGKLKVIDLITNKVVMKTTVAMPVLNTLLLGQETEASNIFLGSVKYLPLRASEKDYASTTDYMNVVDKLKIIHNHGVLTIGDNIMFASTSRQTLASDMKSILLNEKDYTELFRLITLSYTSPDVLLHKGILMFPKNLPIHSCDMNFEFETFKRMQKKIKEKLEKENRRHVDAINKAAEERKKIAKELEKQKKKALKKERIKRIQKHNEEDSLYSLWLFNNPGLSTIFSPYSLISWKIFFSELNVNQNNIDYNLGSLDCFENIDSAKYRKTDNGYMVDFYTDDDPSSVQGTLIFDDQNNRYELCDASNEKVILSVDDNGRLNQIITSANGDCNLEMNLMGSNSGFVGNWASSTNGDIVSASVAIDNNFYGTSNFDNVQQFPEYKNGIEVDIQKPAVYSDNSQADQAMSLDIQNNDIGVNNDSQPASYIDVQNNDFGGSNDNQSPSYIDIQNNDFGNNKDSSGFGSQCSVDSSPAYDTSSWVSSDPYSN